MTTLLVYEGGGLYTVNIGWHSAFVPKVQPNIGGGNPKGGPNLTPKQADFVREYLVDLNGTRAAIRAGYSPKSAAAQASTLLRVPKVQAAIAAAQGARAQKTDITAERVLLELKRIAFVDVAKAFNAEGNLLKPLEMPEDVRAALQGVDFAKTGDRIGRFSEKARALELLGKHLGMFKEKVEVGGDGGGPVVVDVVMLKAET